MERPTPTLAHPAISRRAALQAGAIGLLGLGMGDLSRLRAAPASGGPPKARAKSVIYIFLSGGLSQIDSFDPKPDAPEEFRGEFSPIKTRTPGLHICGHLPMLAQRSHRWSVCRSLTHPWNEHSQGHHIMLTGRSDIPPGFDPRGPKPSDYPSLASIAARLLPQRGNLPPAVVLPEKLVHRTGRVIPGQFGGAMGPRNDPFFIETSKYDPNAYGAYPAFRFHHRQGPQSGAGWTFREPDFTLPQGVGMQRLRDRVALADHLNAQQQFLESAAETQSLDRYSRMALSLLSDDKTKRAFDVHGADPKVLDRYGRNAFGWSLLMARQLVETGVRLVQVNLGNNETWDNHEAIFPNLRDFLFPPMDRAVSALLDDLGDRGMLGETLVVMASEFGRTPKIFTLDGAKLPGRDHWGAVQSVLLAGGGIPGGAVLGSSDKIGGHPASDAQTPEDLAATIYEALGLPRDIMWEDTTGRPHRIYYGQPMRFA
ncbi:MAG: DUF1501 domain-containing protein [Verrucomicrobiales bacterium]